MKPKCLACFAIGKEGEAWMYFGFNHLESGWLCPNCQPEWVPKFEKMQAKGL